MSNDTDGQVVITVSPFAERLRYKGKMLRFTRDGATTEYRVATVSMPDMFGRCTLTLEQVA